VIGGGGERGQDCGQQESQPFEQASEVVAGGGEDAANAFLAAAGYNLYGALSVKRAS
jgi:hypothetical protein